MALLSLAVLVGYAGVITVVAVRLFTRGCTS